MGGRERRLGRRTRNHDCLWRRLCAHQTVHDHPACHVERAEQHLLGLAVCMARLSSNWLLARLSGLYIELVRNIPLLLQMFVWYAALLFGLPGPGPGAVGPFDLDNRGLHPPALSLADPGRPVFLIAIVACAILLGAVRRGAVRTRTALAFAGISLVPLLLWGGIDLPRAGRFGTVGGLSLSTEFLTLVASLSVYASAYLAEIFRGAILAIPRGQIEAGISCGMTPLTIFRRITWPQMVRHALPSFTNNWLVLIKATALVSVIGLHDLVWNASTAGRSVREPFAFMFAVLVIYLVLTAFSDVGLRWLDRRYSAGVRQD